MPQFIRFNLFPLHIDIADAEGNTVKTHPTARVIVTDEDVHVYVDDYNGPSIFFTDRLEDFSGDAQNGWIVSTTDNFTLNFSRGGGCGCGSRLKGFNPFPGVPYEKTLK